MSTIVFLIEQIAPALYIFIGLAVFWYWRQWGQARRNYRTTSYMLERDLARYRVAGSLTAIVLLFEAGLVVAGIQRVVAPTVREDRETLGIANTFQQSVEDGDFHTPAPSPPSGTLPIPVGDYDLGAQQEFTIRLTPIPTDTPVGTIDPADDPSGCNTPYAMLQIPANGMKVFQTIRVDGIANYDSFSSYKLELSGPGTLNQFVTLDEGTIPLTEVGTLSQFNPSHYEPGTYLFRLMVFDTTTTLQAHCEITIYITEPIPTPTPFF